MSIGSMQTSIQKDLQIYEAIPADKRTPAEKKAITSLLTMQSSLQSLQRQGLSASKELLETGEKLLTALKEPAKVNATTIAGLADKFSRQSTNLTDAVTAMFLSSWGTSLLAKLMICIAEYTAQQIELSLEQSLAQVSLGQKMFDISCASANQGIDAAKEQAWGEIMKATLAIAGAAASLATMATGIYKMNKLQQRDAMTSENAPKAKLQREEQKITKSDASRRKATFKLEKGRQEEEKLITQRKAKQDEINAKQMEIGAVDGSTPAGKAKLATLQAEEAKLKGERAQIDDKIQAQQLDNNAKFDELSAQTDKEQAEIDTAKASIAKQRSKLPDPPTTPEDKAKAAQLDQQEARLDAKSALINLNRAKQKLALEKSRDPDGSSPAVRDAETEVVTAQGQYDMAFRTFAEKSEQYRTAAVEAQNTPGISDVDKLKIDESIYRSERSEQSLDLDGARMEGDTIKAKRIEGEITETDTKLTQLSRDRLTAANAQVKTDTAEVKTRETDVKEKQKELKQAQTAEAKAKKEFDDNGGQAELDKLAVKTKPLSAKDQQDLDKLTAQKAAVTTAEGETKTANAELETSQQKLKESKGDLKKAGVELEGAKKDAIDDIQKNMTGSEILQRNADFYRAIGDLMSKLFDMAGAAFSAYANVTAAEAQAQAKKLDASAKLLEQVMQEFSGTNNRCQDGIEKSLQTVVQLAQAFAEMLRSLYSNA